MVRETCVTTSWDDGHPLDIRVAELLNKYGLRGTFYVPMRAETQIMTVPQLRELSTRFEVGAHTLAHTVLTSVGSAIAWEQIAGGRLWLQDTLGGACCMFCPPSGKFSTQHIGMVQTRGLSRPPHGRASIAGTSRALCEVSQSWQRPVRPFHIAPPLTSRTL